MSKLKAPSPAHILVHAGWVHPDQKCIILRVYDHTFNVRAMSRDKISFVVPSTFTIGIDYLCSFKFVKYLSAHVSPGSNVVDHVDSLVRGVVEDQIRVVAASMTMEEIFKGIKQFRQLVFNLVQLQLDQFGLCIHKADIQQLQLDHSHFCSRYERMGKQIKQAQIC